MGGWSQQSPRRLPSGPSDWPLPASQGGQGHACGVQVSTCLMTVGRGPHGRKSFTARTKQPGTTERPMGGQRSKDADAPRQVQKPMSPSATHSGNMQTSKLREEASLTPQGRSQKDTHRWLSSERWLVSHDKVCTSSCSHRGNGAHDGK